MKIKGQKVSGANYELVFIPRPEGDIVFRCGAILDDSEFDRLVVKPEPPTITRKGGVSALDFDDEDYKKALDDYTSKRYDWMIINSVAATPDFEWETVKLGDPTTWKLYREEFKDSGLSQVEVNRIIRGVMIANSLDDRKIEEARQSFLLSAQARQSQ